MSAARSAWLIGWAGGCGGGGVNRHGCRSAQQPLDLSKKDLREGGDGLGAVGQEAAQPLRHGDHPLPHGDRRDDVIDEMGGGLRHEFREIAEFEYGRMLAEPATAAGSLAVFKEGIEARSRAYGEPFTSHLATVSEIGASWGPKPSAAAVKQGVATLRESLARMGER